MTQLIEQLALLRMAVGLLGEQANPKWWTSAFCSKNGKAFLEPIFPRTYLNAQYQGVVSAAALVHDDRIGVGEVFHLFRLPEDMEQALHSIAITGTNPQMVGVMKDRDSAMQFLRGFADSVQKPAQGPVRVGNLSKLRETSSWKDAAVFYFSGFELQQETFPFLSDRA
ncbi:MAG: BrxE family protein [Bacteroidota bacterium]